MGTAFRLLVALAVAAFLAGCTSGVPPDTPSGEAPPHFAFENDDTVTWEVTMYLAEGPLNDFTVTFSDGSTQVFRQTDIPGHAADIEPATEILARETYTIPPGSNLFVTFSGCTDSTAVWFKHTRQGQPNYGYGPGYPCEGYAVMEVRAQNFGGTHQGGDYRDILESPDTVRRELLAQ